MRAKVSMILCLLLLFTIVVAGCGGGQSGDGEERAEKAGSNKLTTVSGTLGRVDLDTGWLTLRQKKGEEPLRFRFNPSSVRVLIKDREASPRELTGGQKAEVGYFERNGRKVARTVEAKGSEFSTANGTLGVVDLEKGRLTLRQEKGEEPLRFSFNPDNPKALKVAVEGKEASPEDLTGGQRAEVRYLEKNGRKVARAVFVENGDKPGG